MDDNSQYEVMGTMALYWSMKWVQRDDHLAATAIPPVAVLDMISTEEDFDRQEDELKDDENFRQLVSFTIINYF